MAKEPKKLEPIKNEKSRLATFKKRKNSLLKKAWEFKTLCDVDACMIIYGPKQKDQPGKAETWASEEGKLASIINRYKGAHNVDLRHRTAGSLPDLNENKVKEVDDTVKQVPKKSRRLECATWDQRFDSFSEDQMKKALCRLNTRLAATVEKINTMKGGPKAMRKLASETSEDSQISHNHIHNVDSHRQGKGKSTAIQPLNNQVYQMPYLSLNGTPIWMRRDANNPYQNGGASSSTISPQQAIVASRSTIPFIPLRPPVQWDLASSQHPLQGAFQWCYLPWSQTPLPGPVQWNLPSWQPNPMSSSTPNENTTQPKKPSVNPEVQQPGQQQE